MKILVPFIFTILLTTIAFAQDHSENLSGPFENVQQVTEECLMCHEDVGNEVLQSNHWNWLTSNLTESVQYEKTFENKCNLLSNLFI